MSTGTRPVKVKRRDAASSSPGTNAAGLAAEAERASNKAAEKAAKLAAEQAEASSGNIPAEMQALWEMFSPEDRAAMLTKHRVHNLVMTAYKTLAGGLKALKIKATDPMIITADGRLLDPSTYNIDDDEEENEENDDGDDDEATDDDGDEEDDERPWTKTEARQLIRHLKSYMRDADVSQTDIASALGVTQACVSSWLRKKDATLPRQGNLHSIAAYLMEHDEMPDDDDESEEE